LIRFCVPGQRLPGLFPAVASLASPPGANVAPSVLCRGRQSVTPYGVYPIISIVRKPMEFIDGFPNRKTNIEPPRFFSIPSFQYLLHNTFFLIPA
jgi:hypothetical protein